MCNTEYRTATSTFYKPTLQFCIICTADVVPSQIRLVTVAGYEPMAPQSEHVSLATQTHEWFKQEWC